MSEDSKLWHRTRPKFMGDLEQRPRVVELLGEVIRGTVLEVGCGTGYLARMIAQSNSSTKVHGIDKDFDAIEIARDVGTPIGYRRISYHHGNFLDAFTPRQGFNAITCVGTMHRISDLRGLFTKLAFFLNNNGRLVVSTPHPYLFSEDSPARKRGRNWVKYTPISGSPSRKNNCFRERYYDNRGEFVESRVYAHSQEDVDRIVQYNNSMSKIFGLGSFLGQIHSEDLIVKKDHLRHPSWGKQFGYPAYRIMVFEKKSLEEAKVGGSGNE